MSTDEIKRRAHIISLEAELHSPAIRSQPQRVEKILHPEFFETGRSGRRFSREATIESLAQETEAQQIYAEEFELVQLDNSTMMLTYRSYQIDEGKPIRQTLRSSIWTNVGKGSENWQLRFHQGTPAAGSN